ncbi:DUF3307 domain-containing protein [Tropicimonas sp. IMCC6043]|uniref:DUF3307 domain-containing protein n=1 Tax=Tropicimonas sp. IMCC6043 TaxID=2510645 RepID=UPI00101D1FE4|nr:DUF3307 domain-containing protein [Tropicimonas sp. IMCC6043]RYH11580.1 DUF3307 domain-containing protein [Tropicimonas sp. IMCC6043]
MTVSATMVLLLVLALQVKHLVADFYLQTAYMLSRRGRYLHPGRALHCLVHILGTTLVLFVFGTPPGPLAAILLAEFVIHFHIDWGKAQIVARRSLTPEDAAYWHATGVDQALHHATYIGIAGIWAGL